MVLPPKLLLPAFFLVLLVGTAALGPLFYFVAGHVHPVPFHRAMDRALLIAALLALVMAWPRLTFRQWWPPERAGWELFLGLLMALVSAQAMIGIGLANSGFVFNSLSGSEIMVRIGMALSAALIVSLLEETLFRGFLQSELTALGGGSIGWLGTATVFMIAHFLKIPSSLDSQPVHATSGFAALAAAFGPLGQGAFLSGKGLNLFLIGLILGGLVLRSGSGSLWVNAGLHSGWVFIMLLWTGLTQPAEHPTLPWLGGDIVSNFGTTLVLLLLALWVWRFFRNPSNTPEAGEKQS
jgi:membrane protease YdiL (CAAX protease family)